jgi:hypothetical protein
MATTLDSFRFPRRTPEFVLYNGPPKPKSVCRRTRKDALPTDNDWVHMDGILEATPEAQAASGEIEPLIPTMIAKACGLLYSGSRPRLAWAKLTWPTHADEVEREDGKGLRFSKDVSLEVSNIKGFGATQDRVLEGSGLGKYTITKGELSGKCADGDRQGS